MRAALLAGLVMVGAAGGTAAADAGAGWRSVLRTPDAPRPPWRLRTRPAPERPWEGLAPVEAWPAEPAQPREVEAERLAGALEQLCGKLRSRQTFAGWIMDASAEFDVDPFLVAAVIYQQSRCRSQSSDGLLVAAAPRGAQPARRRSQPEEVGLARIRVQTHARFVRGGSYRFWTLTAQQWDPWELEPEQQQWTAWELDVSRFPLSRKALEHPRASVYHAAALLAVYRDQCEDLDAVIRSEPHRHFVSHFFWGDRVLGARFEDEALLARRRLIALYGGSLPEPRASFMEVPLSGPLDGAPRVVSSGYNDRREGRRRHRGIDFFSAHGELVRAVADGTVVFAGVHQRGRPARSLGASAQVSRSAMGRGGLFVLVDHGHGLTSGYFHLAWYIVRKGTAVKAGQVLGTVGHSGMIDPRSHLHFELRLHGRNIDPTAHLRPYLLPASKGRRRHPPSA